MHHSRSDKYDSMKNYNRSGKNYDETRCADPFIVSRLAHHLGVKCDGSYLDAACGTGNYTFALAEKYGGAWFGVDCAELMIEAARLKSETVKWQLGDVSALPFPDVFFDGASCTVAIHHFEDLACVFGEIRRVLKPKGAFVIFTATPEQTRKYCLTEYFPDAIEKSAAALPGLKTIFDALAEAGFCSIETEEYSVHEDLQDFFLYSGKYKPEIYLDKKIRRNISTFAQLAELSEVEKGCRLLAVDIESGRISSVIELCKNSSDYIFVTAK